MLRSLVGSEMCIRDSYHSSDTNATRVTCHATVTLSSFRRKRHTSHVSCHCDTIILQTQTSHESRVMPLRHYLPSDANVTRVTCHATATLSSFRRKRHTSHLSRHCDTIILQTQTSHESRVTPLRHYHPSDANVTRVTCHATGTLIILETQTSHESRVMPL